MQAYPSAPADDKQSVTRPNTRRPRPLAWCLAHTWTRNANFRSAAHCKRRMRSEGELARGLKVREALVAALRKRADRSHRREACLQAAQQLAIVTPASLGVEAVLHPARGGSKRELPWYIPDAALPAVAVFLGLVRWAKLLIDEHARGEYLARMKRVRAMLAAIVRDQPPPTEAPPHTRRLERESKTLSLSSTSEQQLEAWLSEKTVRRILGGGGEVA